MVLGRALGKITGHMASEGCMVSSRVAWRPMVRVVSDSVAGHPTVVLSCPTVVPGVPSDCPASCNCHMASPKRHMASPEDRMASSRGCMATSRGAWRTQGHVATDGVFGHPTVSPGHPTVVLSCPTLVPGVPSDCVESHNCRMASDTDRMASSRGRMASSRGRMASSRGAWRPQGAHGILKGRMASSRGAWHPQQPVLSPLRVFFSTQHPSSFSVCFITEKTPTRVGTNDMVEKIPPKNTPTDLLDPSASPSIRRCRASSSGRMVCEIVQGLRAVFYA